MNDFSLKELIDKIIDDTFTVISAVYQQQKESNFTADGHLNSLIVFPEKKHPEEDRISEQELRFIFVEQFNKSSKEKNNNLFYSIETPTVNYYDFSEPNSPRVISKEEHKKNGIGRAANIDLVIFGKKNEKTLKRVALIEFKAHNPDKDDYLKDICKLINEEPNSACLKYFIQIVNIKRKCTELKNSSTLINIRKEKIQNNIKSDNTPDYNIFYRCYNLGGVNDEKNQCRRRACGIIKDNDLEFKCK